MHWPSRRLRRRALFVATALLLVWFAVSLVVVWKLTHRHEPRVAERAPSIDWASLREQRIATRDGEDLGAWWLEVPGPRAVALLLHGNDSGRRECTSTARAFAAERVSCLALTLRAHGDSSGETNDLGWSARADVLAAVAEIERVHPRLPVLVRGFSLGSAAAVFAAGELGTRVRGYLLEMPYRDLDTAVANRTRIYLPPVLDWIAALGLQAAGRVVLPDAGAIAPIERIGDIPAGVPVLILNGRLDPRARPSEAIALLERAGGHARLVTFEDAGHVVLAGTNPEAYALAVHEWLELCLR